MSAELSSPVQAKPVTLASIVGILANGSTRDGPSREALHPEELIRMTKPSRDPVDPRPMKQILEEAEPDPNADPDLDFAIRMDLK